MLELFDIIESNEVFMKKVNLSFKMAAIILSIGFVLTTFIGCPPVIEHVENYTVTFKNDGTVYSKVEVPELNKVQKPSDPVKTGYKFLGWFEEGKTSAFDFSTLIRKDTTLIAKWEELP